MMVMLRSSSFLKRTVCTPEMAFTTVDLPCATWPMVPALDQGGGWVGAWGERWRASVSGEPGAVEGEKKRASRDGSNDER